MNWIWYPPDCASVCRLGDTAHFDEMDDGGGSDDTTNRDAACTDGFDGDCELESGDIITGG